MTNDEIIRFKAASQIAGHLVQLQGVMDAEGVIHSVSTPEGQAVVVDLAVKLSDALVARIKKP